MLRKKISRIEFLKIAGVSILGGFLMPFLKKINFFKKEFRQKEASYYKKLAG